MTAPPSSGASPTRQADWKRSRLSITGIVFMIFGLGLVIFESRFEFMADRLGTGGHIMIIICGTAFSVWGLKEVVASIWPRLAGQGYHFLLPREGAIYLMMMCMLLIGAILGSSNLLLMVFSAMAGPFVMNGWYTFTMLRQLRVTRLAPPRVMAGEPFSITVFLENRKSWLSVWIMTVQDSVRHASGTLHPEVLFARVPGMTSRPGHYQVKLNERGRYLLGPVEVTTRFPLGLVQRGVGLDVHQELLVFPRLGSLRPEWRRQLQQSTELVHNLRPVHGAFQDDMHRLREYRPGDDPRLIHWRTSARANELMVCEYHESRDRDLLLVVDGWMSGNPTEAEREDFERGMRFVATICMDFLGSSRQSALTVTMFGKETVTWRGDSGEHHADTLLDGLALFSAGAPPELATLVEEIDPTQNRQRRTIIVTLRPNVVRSRIQESFNGLASDVQVFGMSQSELSRVFMDERGQRRDADTRRSSSTNGSHLSAPDAGMELGSHTAVSSGNGADTLSAASQTGGEA